VEQYEIKEQENNTQDSRGKSHSVFSLINPRKIVLRKDSSAASNENFKSEESKSFIKDSSFGDFNPEFADLHRLSGNLFCKKL